MKFCLKARSGMTLVEMMVSTVLIGVIGLVVFSLLNIGTILGAKNTAVNGAHQQARVAMLQMSKNLRSSISPLVLFDLDPVDPTIPVEVTALGQQAAGISFQLWSIGPLEIAQDAAGSQKQVKVQLTGSQLPKVDQRLHIPTRRVESDIVAVAGTAPGVVTLTLKDDLPVAGIQGTGNPTKYNVSCFVSESYYYVVKNGALQFGRKTAAAPITLISGMAEDKPFKIQDGPRLVADIGLSTADSKYNNREFKSTNTSLNETVPIRAKLAIFPAALPTYIYAPN